jgi:predicted dehydrogenase
MNYVRVFNELPGTEVTYACDLRTERLELVKRRSPGTQSSTSVDDLVHSGDVDAVVVATPACTHFDLTRKCLEHGKHVLVEKPITTNCAAATELAALARAQNLVLLVGHTFIFNPGIRAVKSYIDTCALGQMYYLHATRTFAGQSARVGERRRGAGSGELP